MLFFFYAPNWVNLHMDPSVISLPAAVCNIGDGVLVIAIAPSLMLFPLCPFIFCCAEAQSALSSSSGRTTLYVGVDLWEEMSLETSYAIILDPSLKIFI